MDTTESPSGEAEQGAENLLKKREGKSEREESRFIVSGMKKMPIGKIGGVVLTFLAIYISSTLLNILSLSHQAGGDAGETSEIVLSLPSMSDPMEIIYKKTLHASNGSRFTSHFTMEGENPLDVRLKSPFTAIIAGPTGSGKTVLMRRLIESREDVSTIPPSEVIYCYGVWQNAFEEMDNVSFREGMIDFKNDLPSDGKHRWLIIDDLMSEMGGNDEADNLFAKYSHHKNVSVFFIVQNFFSKGNRTMTLNSHYLFLFKNPRDASQIGFLARQLFPDKPKFLIESYKDATVSPHSYLTLDLKQDTDDEMRVLGNFLPQDPSEPIFVYTPK